MKVFVITSVIIAFAQACTEYQAPTCGDHDQVCTGGFDAEGCPHPDYCYPKDCKYNEFTIKHFQVQKSYLQIFALSPVEAMKW